MPQPCLTAGQNDLVRCSGGGATAPGFSHTACAAAIANGESASSEDAGAALACMHEIAGAVRTRYEMQACKFEMSAGHMACT